MTVVVLYFAALRELLGMSEERLSVSVGSCTVTELGEHLALRHPALRPHLPSVRLAVNESFAEAGDLVRDGDTVALIPPVSGG